MSQDNGDAKAFIADLVARSRAAQKQIEYYSQEQVDALIRAMVWSVARPGVAEEIAQFTVDETQLGNYDGKFLKIQRKTRATLLDIIHDKSVGVIEEYPERNIRVLAKPLGVIGALAPSTNPEATPVIKGIHAVKGRNSIIVAPHPRAKLTNKKICDLMRAALKKMGAPEDLVIGIETPSLESTNELMRQCDLVLATGGGAMVSAAYSSGTPALGVGVGNAVITVDDTADLDAAAEKIRLSKTLDLAASCSSDNSVVLLDGIYEPMLEKLKAQGGYLCNEEEKTALRNTLWDEELHLNTAIVAQPPEKIAQMAGLNIPEGDPVFYCAGGRLGPRASVFGREALGHYGALPRPRYRSRHRAHPEHSGLSRSGPQLRYLLGKRRKYHEARANTYTSRVMVNQPQSASNSGNVWNGMRQTFSLGCGSWGGNGTNNNITWRDLINETWVSMPLAEHKVIPSDEELFGNVIAQLG